MTNTSSSGPAEKGGRPARLDRETCLVLVLAALAMLRVFLIGAAFPFFNPVDEDAHFDTVVKYSRLSFPRRGQDRFETETIRNIVYFRSQEYYRTLDDYEAGRVPALAVTNSPAVAARILREAMPGWRNARNHEAHSPPLYYVIAGLWYRLGRRLGLDGWDALYAVRFLNVPIYGLLVWFSYRFCRDAYADRPLVRVGAPLLLAVLPQGVFYTINADVLSPLLVVLALCAVHRVAKTCGSQPRRKTIFRAAGAGLLVAAAFLTKLSNFPAFLLLPALFLLLRQPEPGSGEGQNEAAAAEQRPSGQTGLILTAATAASSAAPVLLWMLWNLSALGDLTGTAAKVQLLGWTPRPLMQMGSHPLFSPDGLSTFLFDLTASFWRGEMVWLAHRLAAPPLDSFFVFSSGLFLAVCAVDSSGGGALFRRTATVRSSRQRVYNGLFLIMILVFVLSLAVLSLSYDFGASSYPSREYPYFTSGRLILGGLTPFLILYVQGLELLTRRVLKRRAQFLILGMLAAIIAVSEIALTGIVFNSPYNWYNLPQLSGGR